MGIPVSVMQHFPTETTLGLYKEVTLFYNVAKNP